MADLPAVLGAHLPPSRRHLSVPVLDDMTVTHKCEALSRLGLGDVTENHWKNTRRPERIGQAVPMTDRLLRHLVGFLESWDGRSSWEPTSHTVTHPEEVAE